MPLIGPAGNNADSIGLPVVTLGPTGSQDQTTQPTINPENIQLPFQ